MGTEKRISKYSLTQGWGFHSWEREHGHGWSPDTVGAARSTSGLFLPLRPGYRPSTASPRPSVFKLLPRGPRMFQVSLSHAESLLGSAPPFTSWASSTPPARGVQLQKGSTLLLAVKDPAVG